ncbi:DMT family transporter [Cytobacillus gottheilii]|uniref:DMT family transporter n=1 Tax=Cytobacillus gottheilii TaxID=859144 RepID=UPI002494521F|nr:multidrug efflux SMR transporter [Cytobacillus gottheilii]
MKGMYYLAGSIIFEAFGTTMLKLSDGFTNLLPSIGVAAGFLLAFLLLSYALKTMSLSVAYATWSGVGTALSVVIGILLFDEGISVIKAAGVFLVIGGIALLNTATQAQPAGKEVE